MDKIIAKIAGFGVPGLVLLVAMGATGYAGAAAITTALAALGPAGIIGGIAVLGVIGVISNGIVKYGFDKIFSGVMKELLKRGETKQSLIDKVNKYPISKELKRKLEDQIEKYN